MYATQFDFDRQRAAQMAAVTGVREDQALRNIQAERIYRARLARTSAASNWIK